MRDAQAHISRRQCIACITSIITPAEEHAASPNPWMQSCTLKQGCACTHSWPAINILCLYSLYECCLPKPRQNASMATVGPKHQLGVCNALNEGQWLPHCHKARLTSLMQCSAAHADNLTALCFHFQRTSELWRRTSVQM
jgi:hypothetical protein